MSGKKRRLVRPPHRYALCHQKSTSQTGEESFLRDKSRQMSGAMNSIIMNQIRDHALKAFEVPIKLYGTLSLRQVFHPLFLRRNLLYIKQARRAKVDAVSHTDSFHLELERLQINNANHFSNFLSKTWSKKEFYLEIVALKIEETISIGDDDDDINEHKQNRNETVYSSTILAKFDYKDFVIHTESDANKNLKRIALKLNQARSNLRLEFGKYAQLVFKLCIGKSTYETRFSHKNFESNKMHSLKFNDEGIVKNSLKFSIRCCDSVDQKRENFHFIKSKLIIIYQFFSPETSISMKYQQKCEDKLFQCPFCSFKANNFFAEANGAEFLMKRHFNLEHFRLNFSILFANQNCIKCEIKLNKNFDSSFSTLSADSAYLGYSNTRQGPQKYLFYEMKSHSNSFTLFSFFNTKEVKALRRKYFQIDDDIDLLVNSAKSRIYYSSLTNQIKKDCDKNSVYDEYSSDEENGWFKEQTHHYLQEFEDVNDGEKDLMSLWNLHRLDFSLWTDSELKSFCLSFIDKNSQELSTKLKNNFLVHLANLKDLNLFSLKDLLEIIDYFNKKNEVI